MKYSLNESHIILLLRKHILKGCGLNIFGEGTLTIETTNDSTNRVIVNSSTAGDLSIVSDSLVVNINSVKGYSYAAELYSGLIVTGGVELNINAPAGYGLHVRKDGYLSINNGAKLNIYTGYDNGIRLEENTTAHFEGKGTVVTLDTDSARSGDYAIDDNGNFLEVSDHAKVIIEKCRTNTTEELIFSNCELDVVGGILEFRAPGGESFPADKPMIRTQKDKLECNKHGMTNGYFKNLYGYDYLHIETAASTWIYKGDTPYIEFDKQPVNKYIVNGNTAVIDAEAKVVFGEEDQLATYQWYKDGVLIAGATASTYETEEMTDSSAEYYCIASATVDGVDISTKSDTIMVVANFSGKAVRTEALRLNAPGTVSEENEVEGWSWDNDKKILTLENYTHRMTDGTYGIDIPCGSTIILKGTNRIDMISSNAAIHAANGSGKVIVYGDGTLDITCPSNYGIYAEHGIDILGTVEIGNVRINSVLTGSTDIQSVYDSGLSIYKARIVADNEPGIILKNPEQKVFVASQGGVAPAISVAAELNGAAGPVSYQYQWYATDDWANPMENAIPVAKGAVLSAPVKERGGKYYYCEITATYNKKAYKKSTDLYAVVVGAKGLEPLTKKTRLSSESVDHMSDQGWSYDADTYTLTLNNLEAFLPFGYNSSDFNLFEFYGAADNGIHVVLADDSVNHITESCYGLYCYNGNAIEFTGAGVLNYEAGPSGCQGLMYLRSTFASLDINGGAQLNVCGDGRWNAIENSEINITVSNAEATFDNLFSYSYGRNSSVHIAEGGVLNVMGAGEKEAKTVTVDNGGALYLSGSGNSLVIDRTSGTGTLNVSGILSITSDYAAITMVGADPETRINISDSVILTPDAKTVPGLYIRSSGDRHYYGEGNLLIAPSDFVRTDITGVPVITGEAKIGNTLTVGDVLPAGATVSYRWQYAVAKDTPDELWSDASSTDRTFVLDDIYAGKYIRVKVEGNGKYKGTVYSKPTLPVATSGVSIEDFVVEDIHYGRLSTNYSNYPPDLYYPTVIDGEIHVKALADDNNADITIKNITVGFDTKTEEEKTIQGSEGILPVYITGAINTNDIEITVTNGTEKAVYKTYIEYRVSTGTISLASGDSCALILKDKTDTEVLRADYSAKYKWHDFNAGEEYTLSAVSDLDGWYVSKIYSKDYPDCGELIAGERVAKITARNGKGLAFEIKDEDLRCIAPEARAFWNKTSVGYGIKAEWDSPLPTIYYGADHTGEISAALTDEDGNEVILTEKSVSNPQGFSGYFADFGFIVARDEAGNEITLDPAKSYILSLWYDAGDKEKCDVQKIIIPAMDMSMSNHHIVVEKPPYGDIAERTVNVNGRKFSVTTYPVMTDITVDAAEDGNYVIVRVYNSSEVGTTYALLHVRRPDGTVVSEPLIIDVVEPDTEVTAGLSAVSGSMNIYSEEMVTIPVNIIGSGKSIVSAKFVDSNNPAVSDKYLLNVFADREIEVKPVNTPDSDETDWAKVAKSYTGTFKARIELELEGGQVCTTQDYYTLKISASAPKVSAAAVKINSFYQNSSAPIVFKTNATVIEANVDAVKTTAKLAACPDWLSLADNGKTLVLDNSKLINNKWSGKVYLKVWLAGYRMPVQVPVSVAVAYATPKIKLDKATVTLPANHAKYYKYATISVISGDKKEAFSNLGITSVRVANPVELAALSAKDKQAYATSKYYKVRSYDAESGIIELDTYTASVGELPQMPAGKILLYAQVGDNSSQKIALPLTIKTVIDSKVTISMSKKSITLNSNKAVGSEVIDVNLVPSATGYNCRMATVTVTDIKGNGNYNDKINIFFSGYDYHFSTNSLTQPGTYRVNISVPGIAKPAVVDVIVKGVIPTLKADKKSVNIDAFGDYKEGKVQKTTLTLSDSTISRSAGDFSYKVYDSKRNRVDSELSVYFLGSSSEPIVAFIDANSSTKIGKYTVELIYTMPGSGVESVAKVSVNVSGKLPALKTSKVAVTLNSALRKSDMATVTFIKPDKYRYVGYSIEVLDKNNKPVYDVVVCDYDISDGILTMYPGTEAVAGQTYKVVVGNQVTGKINSEFVKNTITVKMATANKATGKPAISQKVITKGALELARDGAKLDVIPSYGGWNMATAIGAVDIPEVTWAIYAYQNKKPYQYGDVLYQYAGDEGKVATSTPGGANEDWFIDVDPTDGISLVLNPSNRFVQEISDLTGLSYSLVVKTTFRNYYGAGEDMVLSTTSAFKVSVGTIKASVPKTSKIIMNKADRLDTKVIKINLIDKDALLYDLSDVKFSDDSIYEATLMYVGGDYAYVAIGWKNDTIPANVKSGKQTLELYAGHNYSGRAKANGTVVLAVDVN